MLTRAQRGQDPPRVLKKEPRSSGKVGTLGWCFGGGWALRLALADPDVTATVVYYGRLESDPEKLKKLAGPVLGIFGAEDRNPSVEQVRAFEAGCRTAGVKCDVHVYDGAGHAFANPTNSRNFRPEAAKDARGKVREFLGRTLK